MSTAIVAIVRMPRLDANDDDARVVDLAVPDGSVVAAGDALCRVEASKTDAEVEAPVAGRVRWVVVEGADVEVGRPICELLLPDTEVVLPEFGGDVAEVGRRVTAKARRRARELGVDVTVLDVDVVDVAAVEAAAAVVPVDSGPSVDSGPMVESFDEPDLVSAATTWTGTMRPPAGAAVVVGGGGHGAVIIDALAELGIRPVGVLDEVRDAGDHVHDGLEVLPGSSDPSRWVREGVVVAYVGVGGTTDNRPRRDLVRRLVAAGFVLPPLVHPSAVVARGVVLGPGSVVLAGAVIGPRVRIGADVLVNVGVRLCHDAQVGDHAHLAPGAMIAGHVRVGAGATVGMGVTVLDRTEIGAGSLVHNGVAVVRDVPPGTVLRGAASIRSDAGRSTLS